MIAKRWKVSYVIAHEKRSHTGIGDRNPIPARNLISHRIKVSASPPLKFPSCPSNLPVSATSRARSTLDRLHSLPIPLASFVVNYSLFLTIAPVISSTPMHRPMTATHVTKPLSSSSSLVDASSTSTQSPFRSRRWISYGSGILDFPLFSSHGFITLLTLAPVFSLVFGLRAYNRSSCTPRDLFSLIPSDSRRFLSACLSSMDLFQCSTLPCLLVCLHFVSMFSVVRLSTFITGFCFVCNLTGPEICSIIEYPSRSHLLSICVSSNSRLRPFGVDSEPPCRSTSDI